MEDIRNINITVDNMTNTNQMVNLTYMLATVFQESCSVMERCLENTNTKLTFSNKQLLNLLLKDVKHIKYLVDRLQQESIFQKTADDDAAESHDEAVGIFFIAFITFVEICGNDKYYQLRSYYLIKLLRKYKKLMNFPIADTRMEYAFMALERKIQDGVWTLDELKNIMIIKEDEDDDKTNQG